MKFAWAVISGLLLVHALAIAGAAAWLGWTGRLDGDRARRAADVFRLTIDEEKLHQAAADQLAQETRETALEAARLEKVANGPLTLQDRLRAEEAADEVATQRVERLRVETSYLRQQLEEYKRLLAEQQAKLERERAEFAASVERMETQRRDEDFRQAVAMYERVRPRQAKEMFQSLMADGQTPQVVEYLAAMQLRKAADVLKEFKAPEEVAQATDLVQRLRERGIDASGGGRIVPATPARAEPQAQTAGGAT